MAVDVPNDRAWLDGRSGGRRLERYLRGGHEEVKGWLHPMDARFIAAIGDLQSHNGIAGGVGEIGVFRGRLFVLLYLLRLAGEKAFCIDVFERQELNVDGSGRGANEELFRENVAKHAGDFDVHVIRDSSETVIADDILSAVGPVRLFSVDGGHTAALTENDLRLAEQSLHNAGVIVLDDYFNRMWPGVSEGCHRFFRKPTKLVPFAVTFNKVLFSFGEHSDFFRSPLRENYPNFFRKESIFLDHPVDIYGAIPPAKKQPSGSPPSDH